MKALRKTFGCLAVILLLMGQTAGQFYYGGGEAIPLAVDSNLVTLRFDEGLDPAAHGVIIGQIGRISGVVTDDHVIDYFVVCSLATGADYDSFLDSLQAVDGVYLVEPYYRDQNDSASLVGTGFCVAFDEGVTQWQINSINAAFGVVIGHRVEGMPNVFVLRNTDSSGYRMLDLANAYYDLNETRYSHPEFGVWIQKCGYKLFDYYSVFQWQTKKVIGSFNNGVVWDFEGLDRPITVAMLDDGVDSHEDLPQERLFTGYDFYDSDYDARPGPWESRLTPLTWNTATGGWTPSGRCCPSRTETLRMTTSSTWLT